MASDEFGVDVFSKPKVRGEESLSVMPEELCLKKIQVSSVWRLGWAAAVAELLSNNILP